LNNSEADDEENKINVDILYNEYVLVYMRNTVAGLLLELKNDYYSLEGIGVDEQSISEKNILFVLDAIKKEVEFAKKIFNGAVTITKIEETNSHTYLNYIDSFSFSLDGNSTCIPLKKAAYTEIKILRDDKRYWVDLTTTPDFPTPESVGKREIYKHMKSIENFRIILENLDDTVCNPCEKAKGKKFIEAILAINRFYKIEEMPLKSLGYCAMNLEFQVKLVEEVLNVTSNEHIPADNLDVNVSSTKKSYVLFIIRGIAIVAILAFIFYPQKK
jgi:hypothetical protein